MDSIDNSAMKNKKIKIAGTMFADKPAKTGQARANRDQLLDFSWSGFRILDIHSAEKILAEYKEFLYEGSDNDPEPEPFITTIAKNQTVANRGELMQLVGLPKSGKTAIAGALTAKAISRAPQSVDGLGMDVHSNGMHFVVYVSTELPKSLLKKHINAIVKRAGPCNRKRLVCMNLYGQPPKICIQATRAVILALHAMGGVELVIIDGIAEYVSSPNDEKESNEVISIFENIGQSTNAVIFTIIHSNSGSEGKPRGHMGSQGTRKGSATLHVKKHTDGRSVVTAKHLRYANEAEFEPIFFGYDSLHGMHALLEGQGLAKKRKNNQIDQVMLIQLMKEVFMGREDQVLRTAEILKKLPEGSQKLIGKKWGEERCTQILSKASDEGIVHPAVEGKIGKFVLDEKYRA